MASNLDAALDKALAIPANRVADRVARMRAEHPWATTAELIDLAGARFRRDAGLTSGAVGASAALPAVGTGTATALTVGQTGMFLASAVTYVLSVAELHGLRVVDPERRRALVMSSLLGQQGAEAVQGQLGLSTLFWAAQMLAQMPIPTVRTVNKDLAKRLSKRQATKTGALALGRLLPFGIGAIIGWSGGRALANEIIEGTTAALGPAKLLEDGHDVVTI
ncbi:hypothetical protein [Actinomyces trachealis]|uniref:hypothetical protein n=1 Tax=Actinomyces trachealis TaxID=2763540 RepID=UPI001892B7D5|nr:hypothetical protein [Actinomyces trachealis]